MTVKLEVDSRKIIDRQLAAAGWTVAATSEKAHLPPKTPVALCEEKVELGRADYVLYLDGKACGILEAKRSDHSLQGVQEQSASYAAFRNWQDPDTCGQSPLPFRFEANGQQIQFTDARDPQPRARNIFHLPKPGHLQDRLTKGDADNDTLRRRLHALPEASPLDSFLATASKPLRDCQHEAITNLEASLALETTLATRTYLRLIPRWQAAGYLVKLCFLKLPDATFAIRRVAQRITLGGHAIPEETIRRRFLRGWLHLRNDSLFLIDEWSIYDASKTPPALLETGDKRPPTRLMEDSTPYSADSTETAPARPLDDPDFIGAEAALRRASEKAIAKARAAGLEPIVSNPEDLPKQP